MVTVFWYSVGVILVDFMSKRTTIHSDVYIDTLNKLKARIQRVQPALEMSRSSAPLGSEQFHIPIFTKPGTV